MSPDELHQARTQDGCRIALSRWRPVRTARPLPVLLCHGLGNDRESFDLAPEASLARNLAGRGHDVWAVELRGHGRSERPARPWSFDDFLDQDLPAALAALREKTGRPSCHFVGHSMGGLLLLAHLARGGGGIVSGVTIGSTLDYSRSTSDFRFLVKLKSLMRLLPALPLRFPARLFAVLACRFANPFDAFNIQWTNVDPGLYRLFLKTGIADPSAGVLLQLASAVEGGGLRSRDDALNYFERLKSVTTPLLFLAGDVDRQCPPAAARVSFDALGSPDKRWALFGKASGQADHYGHMDLIFGRRAAAEVFPAIAGWLEERGAT